MRCQTALSQTYADNFFRGATFDVVPTDAGFLCQINCHRRHMAVATGSATAVLPSIMERECPEGDGGQVGKVMLLTEDVTVIQPLERVTHCSRVSLLLLSHEPLLE